MSRTLKTYLGRDLARATALATVAFTLVITVFAVIEPLREQGMSGRQAMRLFGYIMPVMLSLTLPVAALFAATIVYGRFSRDNELMACRASGIHALSLLGPAIWLAIIVSAITLLLGLYVAPNLLSVSERTIKKNFQQIVYYRLKKKSYFDYSDRIFHADRVHPDSKWVEGVVGIDFSDPDDVGCLIASSAKLEFVEQNGEAFVRFHPTNPTLMQQGGGYMGMASELKLLWADLPSLKDKPKFYDWTKLCRTWSNPKESPVVLKEIEKIKRKICIRNFYEDVISRIKADGKYESLVDFVPPGADEKPGRIVIEAARAEIKESKELHLLEPSPATSGPSTDLPKTRNVVIRQYSDQRLKRLFRAKKVIVQGNWNKLRSAVLVTITLSDVAIMDPSEHSEDAHYKDKYDMGPFAVPAEIVAASKRIMPDELYDNAAGYSHFPVVHSRIKNLHDKIIPRLLDKVCAEIHQRLAYGISCLLMVMLGAALGLIFRGGEVLVAFAISAGPASVVIVVILMGKQLISNPGVPAEYGIAAIWGGIALLAAATVYVYAVPMRR